MSLFKYTEREEKQKDTRPIPVQQQELYDQGCEKLRSATNEDMYKEAAAIFESIPEYPNYRDAQHKATRCYEMAEVARKDAIFTLAAALLRRGKFEDVSKALELYQSIPGWKNADRDVIACEEAFARLRAEEEAKAEAERQKQAAIRAKRERQIAIVKKVLAILLALAATVFAAVTIYNTAITLNRNQGSKRLFGRVLEVGDTIQLGRYEQDNVAANGPDQIEWVVLARKKGKVLVTSTAILEARPYNEKQKGITWEECTLRAWLNGEFLNTAFTAAEQQLIADTQLENPDYSTMYNYNPITAVGGNPTVDKLFLLTKEDVRTYMTDRKLAPTAYALARGAGTHTNGCAWWWLRNVGGFSTYAAIVSATGSVLEFGDNVEFSAGGVRPAFWLDPAEAATPRA